MRSINTFYNDTNQRIFRLHLLFVLATLPSLLCWLYLQPERGAEFALAGLLITSLLASLFWHLVFARTRSRPLDSGWLMHGWLYALLVPADLSLSSAVLGISFGVVAGALIFGGTGRYIVSPALLGVVFTSLSYPASFLAADVQSVWGQLASSVISEVPHELLFNQTAANVAAGPAAAVLIGTLGLLSAGVISARVILGGLLGAWAAAWLGNLALPAGHMLQMAPYLHLVIGNFAFCIAFVATDPSAAAATRAGRWIYGALIGALTVALRLADPTHPEGAFIACLAASLFAPLIDQACWRIQMWRHRLRQDNHAKQS